MTPSVIVTSRPLRTPSHLPHSEHGSAHGGIHAPCRASLLRPMFTAGLLGLVGLPSPTKCGLPHVCCKSGKQARPLVYQQGTDPAGLFSRTPIRML
eukprot:357241-Chlamydomonas_euryale.AAC.27